MHIPSSVKDAQWNTGPKPETVDEATSYIREISINCEHCGKENKQQVSVACGFNGQLVKLAVARSEHNA